MPNTQTDILIYCHIAMQVKWKQMRKGLKLPKYKIIAQKIATDIKSGKIPPYGKVPSENAIIARYGVSNATSRKVLLHLEMEGLVKRIRGKGTVVLERKGIYLSRALGSYSAIKESFSDNLHYDGIVPSVKIAERELYCGKVNIQIGGNFYEIVGKIFKIRTLRYGNSRLLKDETIYFDASFCSGIENEDEISNLIDTLSSKFKISISNVDRNIGAVLIEGHPYFKNRSPMPALNVEGAFVAGSQKVVAIEKSLYDGYCYKFTIDSKP